jgi:hypothetical protein
MKSVFDPITVNDVKQRILCLHPESQRQWGTMTPLQTVAHCTCGVQMATGTINPRRAAFPASVLGLLIKPLVLADGKPMRRNAPSSPELFPADSAMGDFALERDRLIAAIDSFAAKGAAGCSRHPHPFFGRLSPEQWAILMYKHVDHHLRQFGL